MKIKIDGINFDAPEYFTILEAAKFLGLEIPTLCYHEGLSSWGGCRLCIVEIGTGDRTKLVTSCTYPVEEGLVVRTSSERVVRTRKMILELLISQCPTSKVLQDLASKMGFNKVRFKGKWEDCIYCGLCVRMCEEQMMAKAIGFVNRGNKLQISTPFDEKSDDCRKCGACMYICPVVTLRCHGANPESVLCNGCYNSLQPTCISNEDNYNCWMGLKYKCGTCYSEESKK
ncbi:MAG: 2Fe-2S iron-sulfur cluster binding domain-containing protein [Bacteroidetes bacterium]|nr:2Fe-2S iron-sulfur cluster binding domain-containing protein [Bacteroidota bacterium]